MSSYFSKDYLTSLSEPLLNPCASSFQPRTAKTGLESASVWSPLIGKPDEKIEFYYPNPRASSGLKAYVNSRFCDVSRRDAELLGLLAPRRPLAKQLASRACSYCYTRSTKFCWHPFKDDCNRIVCPLIGYKLAVLKNYRKHRAPCKASVKQDQCNLSVSIAASVSSDESDNTSICHSSFSDGRSSLQKEISVGTAENQRQRAALAQEADRQTCEAEFFRKLQECEREYSSKSSGEMMMYMPVSERIANRSRQLNSVLVTSSKDQEARIAEQGGISSKITSDELLKNSISEVNFMDKSKDAASVNFPSGVSKYFPLTSSSAGNVYNKSDSFKPMWRHFGSGRWDEAAQSSLFSSPSSSGTSSTVNNLKPSLKQAYDVKVKEGSRIYLRDLLKSGTNNVDIPPPPLPPNNHRNILTERWVPVPNSKSAKVLQVPTQNLDKINPSATEELKQALLFLRKHLSNSSVFTAIVNIEKESVLDSIKSLEASIIQFTVVHQQTEHSSLTNVSPCRAISYLNKLIEVRKDEVISLLGASCNNFNEKRLGFLISSLDENCYVQECKFHKFHRQRYWQDMNHLCDFFFICRGKECNDRVLLKVLELLRSIDIDGSNSLGQIYKTFLSSEMSNYVRRQLLVSNGRPLFYLVDYVEYCKLYMKVFLLKLQVQKLYPPNPSRDLNNNNNVTATSSLGVCADSQSTVAGSVRHSLTGSTPAASAERKQCPEFLNLRPRLFPQIAGGTPIMATDNANGSDSRKPNVQNSPDSTGAVKKMNSDFSSSLPNLEGNSLNNEEKGKRSRYNILVLCKLQNSLKNLRIFDYIMDNHSAIVWKKLEQIFSAQNGCGVGVCGNKAFINDIEDRLIVRRDGKDLL